MAIEVFNRHELKYMIDMNMFKKVQERLSDYMELDAHNKEQPYYTIANIYYDTEDNQLIQKSISKPAYKEKLRVRSYGVPDLDETAYVEIKKKVNGVVNKRRSSMTVEETYKFLETGKAPDYKPHMNKQVLREIEFFLTQYQLKPAVYLAYDRRAFFGDGNRDLRVSFDTNIRTRRDDLRLEVGDHGRLLLEEGKVLMEIKTGHSIPLWLTRLLSDYQIYPSSFSKYGKEYVQMMTEQSNERRVVAPPVTHSIPKILTPRYA